MTRPLLMAVVICVFKNLGEQWEYFSCLYYHRFNVEQALMPLWFLPCMSDGGWLGMQEFHRSTPQVSKVQVAFNPPSDDCIMLKVFTTINRFWVMDLSQCCIFNFILLWLRFGRTLGLKKCIALFLRQASRLYTLKFCCLKLS